MKWLRKFLRLPSCDRHLLLYTALLMGLIRLGLWLLPFRVLWRWLTRMVKYSTQAPSSEPGSIQRIVWAVDRVSRVMPGGVKCLARALTSQVLLSRQGYVTQFRIGVAKTEAGQLEAHAWVEAQGRVVMGDLDDLARFKPLPTLEGERA